MYFRTAGLMVVLIIYRCHVVIRLIRVSEVALSFCRRGCGFYVVAMFGSLVFILLMIIVTSHDILNRGSRFYSRFIVVFVVQGDVNGSIILGIRRGRLSD